MTKLTKTQMKALEGVEEYLRKAQNDYLPNPTMQVKEILRDTYKSVFGTSMTNSSCNKCLLRDTKRLAEVYFENKEAKKTE